MEIEIKKVSLSDIKLNPDNPRRIGNAEMEKLIKSIQDFPEMMSLREIVVDETMTVLGGNMRTLALRKTGAKECTAKIVKGLTEAQKREFVIKDNGSMGEWDFDLLANNWSDLPLDDWGVDLPEDWLNAGGGVEVTEGDAEPQIDRAEELNKIWQVKRGDLFSIGEHRLLCGDSTNAEDVTRVIGGEKADMVFTDPPYGIGRGGGFGGFGGFGKPIARRRHKKGEWDKTRPEGEAFELLLSLSDKVFIFGGNFFTDFLPQGNHWLVWDKHNTMPTFGDCELVWTSIGRNSVKKYDFEYNGLIGKEKDRVHPTQKPVGLLVEMIGDYIDDGSIIFDGFIGSGTTMIAAENLKRRCFGIEMSEDYCAVILQRMTDAFPGIEIKRISK